MNERTNEQMMMMMMITLMIAIVVIQSKTCTVLDHLKTGVAFWIQLGAQIYFCISMHRVIDCRCRHCDGL